MEGYINFHSLQSGYKVWVCLLLFLNLIDGHRILLIPMSHGNSSHVTDMVKMADILIQDKHEVHMVLASTSPKKDNLSKFLSVHVYRVPDDVRTVSDDEWKHFMLHTNDVTSTKFSSDWLEMNVQYCQALFHDLHFLESITKMKYDLIIFDVIEQCGKLLVSYLDVPCIEYCAVGYITTEDAMFPHFPSFMPHLFTSFSDDMNFWQRLANFYLGLFTRVLTASHYQGAFQSIGEEHGIHYDVSSSKNSFHMVHAHFAVDFPRPLLPTVVNIGGIFTHPAKPLPEELEGFAQTYAGHGIIVVAFGTLIDALDPKRAEIFAQVFASLPVGVIWRHKGTAPASLGKNTLLLDWLPQNDLLGYPITRLFITHCGMTSTFEAAYHAVPVLAIPLYADQFQNAQKLVSRAKMGELIDIHSLEKESFRNRIISVMNTQVYRENAQKTSELLKENARHPEDVFLHCVYQSIKHKGAAHLQQESLQNLSWIQLYCVDIYLFTLTALLTSVALIIYVIGLVCMIRMKLRGDKRFKFD